MGDHLISGPSGIATHARRVEDIGPVVSCRLRFWFRSIVAGRRVKPAEAGISETTWWIYNCCAATRRRQRHSGLVRFLLLERDVGFDQKAIP